MSSGQPRTLADSAPVASVWRRAGVPRRPIGTAGSHYTAAMKRFESPAAPQARASGEPRHGSALSPAKVLALLADGTELSGSALAARLGITRAAVWKQIEQLRTLGLPIDGSAGHGYRLAAPR